MPNYAYRAVDQAGILNKGQAVAANENDLYEKLHHQGLSLIDCRDGKQSISVFGMRKVSLADQAMLARHLVMLTKAGVPIHVALEDVQSAMPVYVSRHIAQMLDDIKAGTCFSDSCATSRAGFDPLFSLLIAAGEKTGKIAEALDYLCRALTWKNEYKHKLRRALSYPLLQVVLAGTAVTVLMTVAVPQIVQLLQSVGEQLPFASEIILWAMKITGAALVGITILALCAAVFLPLARALHEDVAEYIDRVLLSFPIMGKLLTKVELAQITHVFSAMLGSGIQMMDVLHAIPGLTHNRAMAASLKRIAVDVEAGQGLSAVLTKQLLIPPYVMRILKIGEESGKIADSLKHISFVYQEESEQALDQVLKISSLFITLAVGLILILMVCGVMVPLYRGINHMVAA